MLYYLRLLQNMGFFRFLESPGIYSSFLQENPGILSKFLKFCKNSWKTLENSWKMKQSEIFLKFLILDVLDVLLII